MIGLKLEAAKRAFFDPQAVLDPAARAQLRALAKFGAFVRRRAVSSIRTRKKVAQPGTPPSSHTGLLKKFIFFFVERAEKNVVIGPILLNRGDGDAPRLLEHGGDAVRRRLGRRGAAGPRRLRYRGNPFMQPAFDAELPKAAGLLEGEVT